MRRKDPLAELYAAPIERFIGSRERLARLLEMRGDEASASRVRGAAKPTRAAWVLDRLAREAKSELASLYAAGDRMRASQHGSARQAAERLRAATTARHDALEALAHTARGMLEAHGYPASPTLLRGVLDVLRNASVDPSIRTQIAAATLARLPKTERLPTFTTAVKRPSRMPASNSRARTESRSAARHRASRRSRR